MSAIYLLPCHGESTVEVTTAEAGRTVPCPCGKEVTVPTFREIQQLPKKQIATDDDGAVWSIQQGVLFSVGLVLLAGALVAIALFGYQRMQLNTEEIVVRQEYLDAWDAQIMGLDAEATLDGWNKYLNQPLPENRRPPPFEVDRAEARSLMWKMAIAAGFGVVGAGLMIVSTTLKPRPSSVKRRPKKPAPA